MKPTYPSLTTDYKKYLTPPRGSTNQVTKQLMLQRKILASNVVFTSVVHQNKTILNKYLDNFYDVMNIISKIDQKKIKISKYLKTPVCHSAFTRLN